MLSDEMIGVPDSLKMPPPSLDAKFLEILLVIFIAMSPEA